MAPNLGLSRTASVDEVVEAAARLTGRHRDRVAEVLLTAEPAGDADLVRISDDLAGLEAAVRAAVPGAASTPPPTRLPTATENR
jgi:flavin reductase (DIM6/NTAB) family NADH-FMN oxidoreductase RutF